MVFPTNEVYTLSCFLALVIVGAQPAVAHGLLTCDYAAMLDLYPSHIIMLMCHFIAPLLIARVPLDD